VIQELIDEAIKTNQRRILVLNSEEFEKIKDKLTDFIIFSDKIKGAKKFKNVNKLLGQTIGNVVIDLRNGFLPSDFGIIIGAVKGGSLIILLKDEPWDNKKFYKWMESPNNPKNKFKNYFLEWFDKKLKSAEGVYYGTYNKPKVTKSYHQKIILPESKIDSKILKLAKIQDQVNAISQLENSKVSILIADRGRGKSSAIGLYLANLISNKAVHICVTAPSYENAIEIFKFLYKWSFIYKIEIFLFYIFIICLSIRYLFHDSCLELSFKVLYQNYDNVQLLKFFTNKHLPTMENKYNFFKLYSFVCVFNYKRIIFILVELLYSFCS